MRYDYGYECSDRTDQRTGKKAKTEGLNEEEIVERDKLRRIYIDSVKASLTGQLDNTYIVYPDGTKKKIEPKGKKQ